MSMKQMVSWDDHGRIDIGDFHLHYIDPDFECRMPIYDALCCEYSFLFTYNEFEDYDEFREISIEVIKQHIDTYDDVIVIEEVFFPFDIGPFKLHSLRKHGAQNDSFFSDMNLQNNNYYLINDANLEDLLIVTENLSIMRYKKA